MRNKWHLPLLALCIDTIGLNAQDQNPLQNDPGAHVMELVRKAQSVPIERYVELREEFLKFVAEHPALSETPSFKVPRNWKERVILQAWDAWSKYPEECGTLWRHSPSSKGPLPRNPFPLFASRAEYLFKQHEKIGHAIAMELMLAKNETHFGGLVHLLSEKQSDLAFEVLLECASRGVSYLSSPALESYGSKAAPRILSKLESSDPYKCGAMIQSLGSLKHRPALPELGRILMSVPKDEYNRPYAPNYYGIRSTDLALPVIGAIEQIMEQPIPGLSTNVRQRDSYKTIETAKQWWQMTGRKTYGNAEGEPGASDGSPSKNKADRPSP